ncbi:neprilysin-2-like [Cylas formicarius]|uniref:neprilysin-2-like n=1 Tax=Cylas formicarius TaxID=197179 RepID=UPI0029583AE5|nr:neprilysin-2-like [Cylas formicarius]
MKNGDLLPTEIPSNDHWWKKTKTFYKKIIWCVLCVLCATVIIVGAYYVIWKDHFSLCENSKCEKISAEIIGYIDETIRPCDDFYQFACGGFLRKAATEDVRSLKSIKQNMEEKILMDIRDMLEEPINGDDLQSFNLAKKFYKGCTKSGATNEEGLRKMELIFKEMGGWPAMEGDGWNTNWFGWIAAVRNLRNYGANFNFFFDVNVDVDKRNFDKYILVIKDKFLGSSSISPNNKNDYLKYMVDVASQFYIKSNNLTKEMDDTLNFILKLARIAEESRGYNDTNSYSLFTISELQYANPSIPWFNFIQGVLGEAASLNYNDLVAVSNPSYLRKLEGLLLKTNNRTLANFIAWQSLHHLINYLPSAILNKAYDYMDKVNGVFDRPERWHVCVQVTRQKLSPQINLGYIERYFDDRTQSHVTDLIRNIKYQFRKNILERNWLDNETKERLLLTLLSSAEKIFSVYDLEQIFMEDNAYRDVEINENQLLQAALDLDTVYWNLHYDLLNKAYIVDDWVRKPEFITGFNVEYSPPENILRFPLGLFRSIFYDRDRPEYMNYGLLGSVLAHQISHIFVDAEDGNADQRKLINWWTASSIQKYSDKLECLSGQYRNLYLDELESNQLNTFKTRHEDIADLAGAKIAYDAYRNLNVQDPVLPNLKYTPAQLFWISSALQYCSKYPLGYFRKKFSGNDYKHSPNQFRVNGPLRNVVQFSVDFGCGTTSFMNPTERCFIW